MHTEIESKSRITALRERMLRYTRGIGKIVVGWIKKKNIVEGFETEKAKNSRKESFVFFRTNSPRFLSQLIAIVNPT